MNPDHNGTREQIFDHSIELFSRLGYESVGMRDLAEAVGIKQSSIYNHYESKATILERIYQYFSDHQSTGRPSMSDVMETIQSGAIEEIIQAFTDVSFIYRDQKEATRMIFTTKIIYTRMMFDANAAALYRSMLDANMAFIRDSLDYGISIGRFCPFDTNGFAFGICSMYTQMGIDVFTGPGYKPGESETEQMIKRWMGSILSDRMLRNQAKPEKISVNN